jgi:hypothetical protein
MHGTAAAGGNWPTIGEKPDDRVVVQESEIYCGCACALTIFRILGCGLNPSQDEISDAGGGAPFSITTLSSAMNHFWETASLHGRWAGEGVALPDRSDTDLISTLTDAGPWIPYLYEFPNRLGHFVVVEKLTSQGVQILDPSTPGTVYTMDLRSFLGVWGYLAVHLRTSS